jgi:HEPN domain-containing protein
MEFSFEFSERLIESAEGLLEFSSDKDEAGRAILYLSCLSCEISMKALLERSEYTIRELKRFSHKLHELLDEITRCGHSTPDKRASSIRSKEVLSGVANGTVGSLLVSQIENASTYPNEIRYGEIVSHFPAQTMLQCAKVVLNWCKENNGCLLRATSS